MALYPQHPSDLNMLGMSPALWGDCPLEMIRHYGMGTYFEDDFHDLPTGKYTATQATAGTWALGDSDSSNYATPTPDQYAFGVALADCNSTTQGQGINVQLGGTAGEGFVPRAGTSLWFEARIAVADAATGPQLFIGLANTLTTIITSNAITADTNYVGFRSTTNDNILLFAADKTSATSETTTAGTLLDLEASTTGRWHKVGFKIYTKFVAGSGDVLYAKGYFDGAVLATEMTNLVVPTVGLRPSFVCQTGGTVDPILHVDWVRVAQSFRV